MNKTFLTIIGGLSGILVPASWLIWKAYQSRQAWWDRWLKSEFNRNGETYIILGLISIAILATLGYFIGQKYDELEEESDAIEDSNLELSQLASTDGLTGLLNGRSMQERLDVELDNAHKKPLSSLIVDIDHFKKINDQYGHPFGDEVLVRVATILKKSVRRVDAVGRLGGEEFLIVIPDTSAEEAALIADRIRQAVKSEPFEFEGKSIRVTVSIGVADCHTKGLRERGDLLKAADDALYKAKKAGRNRTIIWKAA